MTTTDNKKLGSTVAECNATPEADLRLRHRGITHSRVGRMSWLCFDAFDLAREKAWRATGVGGRSIHTARVEGWFVTDEPVTCLRCLVPHMTNSLERWM